jgi:hypothetical protein
MILSMCRWVLWLLNVEQVPCNQNFVMGNLYFALNASSPEIPAGN